MRNFEVVVVADRINLSELNRILEKYDLNFRILVSEAPGIVSALNLGLSKINSKYVARMDEDDLMEPDRLKKQYEFMEKHPSVMALGGQLQLIDEDDHMLGLARYQKRIKRNKIDILRKSPIAHPASMFRTNEVSKIGGYRGFLPEDWDLWTRLCEIGEISNHKDLILKYRVHPGQLSRNSMYAQFTGQRFVAASYYARKSGLKDSPNPGESPQDWLERTQIQLRKVSDGYRNFENQSEIEMKIQATMQQDSKISKFLGILSLAKKHPVYLNRFLVNRIFKLG